LPPLLDLAVTARSARATADHGRSASVDPADGDRESELGRSEDSRRVAHARLRHLRANRLAIPAASAFATRCSDALAHVPAQPPRRNCRFSEAFPTERRFFSRAFPTLS